MFPARNQSDRNETNGRNKSSAVAELGNRLATIDMGRKVGGCMLCPFAWEIWVPIEHNIAGTEAYMRTKWHPDPSNRFATIATLQTEQTG